MAFCFFGDKCKDTEFYHSEETLSFCRQPQNSDCCLTREPSVWRRRKKNGRPAYARASMSVYLRRFVLRASVAKPRLKGNPVQVRNSPAAVSPYQDVRFITIATAMPCGADGKANRDVGESEDLQNTS